MATEEKKDNSSLKKRFESKNVSEFFITFKNVVDKIKSVEEKIAKTVIFMREALSQNEAPRLKDFWNAKHLCVSFFKKQMNPIKRDHLWSEYIELNQEARRLKEIINEQSAFAIEQIELAIAALETDFERCAQLIEKLTHIQFPNNIKRFLSNQEVYQKNQQEIHFLKIQVSRLDALRKEAIGLDIRISIKNKLLKRLSKLGDQIFPRRKELIQKISEQFIQDVDSFVNDQCGEKERKKILPYYEILNEIKSFQALAKLLTLNTQAFIKSRNKLSEYWDQVKKADTDRKKEYEERSKEFQKNKEQFTTKIQEFKTFFSQKKHLVKDRILEAATLLQNEMRSIALAHNDVKEMRAEIQKIRKEALDQEQEQINIRIKKEHEQIETLKTELSKIFETTKNSNLESLIAKEEQLLKSYKSFQLSTREQQIFERQFLDLKGFILDKKGERMDTLDELEDFLEERKAFLNQIKQQVEDYRKEMGGSGLDFEKAMTYRELYDSAKIHFDKEVEAMEALEEKIAEKDL